MSYCDDQYTKVQKPTTASTVVARPTASYTIIGKGTRPSTLIVQQPCLELLAILTESGIEILHEDSRVMVTEGALGNPYAAP